MDNPTILRRYTDLPALLYLLKKRAITFLDPQFWDDSNDSHYLQLYKTGKGFSSLLALCFTQSGEAYQHWKVFAEGASGVCVELHKNQLLHAFDSVPGIQKRDVEYLRLTR